MTVGEIIKKLRLQKGLTQKELGDKCGMADSAIRRYELGGANPKIETLQKIAEALGVPVSVLKDFSEHKQDIINKNPMLSTFQQMGDLENEPLAQSILQHFVVGSLDMTEDKQALIYDYNKLNESGRTEARKRIAELTEIPKYQKDNE